MRPLLAAILLSPLFLISASLADEVQVLVAGDVTELIYPPSMAEGELKVESHFYLWLPREVKTLRGVIVHQHGCGTGSEMSGVTGAYDLHWQALASRHDCALLSTSYRAGDMGNCRDWCDPRNGSDARFQQALADFAARSQHPELKSVPWCLWGHSGGGFWGSIMQARHPERIVAIWMRSGTAYDRWTSGGIPALEVPAEAYEVPCMTNPGAKEKGDKRFNGAWTGAVAMFEAYRAKDAPFGFAPDPRTSHECGDQRYAAIAFFDACLTMRLPEPGKTSAGKTELRPVDWSVAWLADAETLEAVPAAEFKGDRAKAIWLPTASFAKVWSEYVKTGSVSDSSPPPAPTQIAVQVQETGVTLTWNAVADIDSGMQAFEIERDGQVIATLPEKPRPTFGRALFQGLQYSDTPTLPLAEMKFVDPAGNANSKYRVISINTSGLRSSPAP